MTPWREGWPRILPNTLAYFQSNDLVFTRLFCPEKLNHQPIDSREIQFTNEFDRDRTECLEKALGSRRSLQTENRFYLSTMWHDCFWLGIPKKVRHGMIVIRMSIENQRKINPRNHFCLHGELKEKNYFDRVVSWIGAVMLMELVWLNWAKETGNEMSYRMISCSFCLSSWEIKSILFSNKTSANATCLREGEKGKRQELFTPLTAVRCFTLTKVLSLDDDHLDSSRLTIESTRSLISLLSIHGNHQSLWSNLIKEKNRSLDRRMHSSVTIENQITVQFFV